MKVILRKYFSIENEKGEVIEGPAEIELSDNEIALNAHKLEIPTSEEEAEEEDQFDDVEKEIALLAKKLCKEEVKGKSKEEKKQILEQKEAELNEEFAAAGVDLKEFAASKLGK